MGKSFTRNDNFMIDSSVIAIDNEGLPLSEFFSTNSAAITTGMLADECVTTVKLADGAYVPAAGGTFSGTVTMGGNLILGAATYGDELPAAGTPGRVFFKKV